jgi:hypothetical protein
MAAACLFTLCALWAFQDVCRLFVNREVINPGSNMAAVCLFTLYARQRYFENSSRLNQDGCYVFVNKPWGSKM